MFGFKRSTKKKKPSPTQQTINMLRAFRDIGERFTYLGTEMVVTAHWKIVPGFEGMPTTSAVLCADYRDFTGKIQTIEFSPTELPGLIKENERANK